MKTWWAISVGLGCFIASAPVAWASHQGQPANESLMSADGTITGVDVGATSSTVQLTTLENRVETLVINPTTTAVWSNGKPVGPEALRVGQRATIQYVEERGRQVATSITLLPPQRAATATLPMSATAPIAASAQASSPPTTPIPDEAPTTSNED